jgi:hypothetical protein
MVDAVLAQMEKLAGRKQPFCHGFNLSLPHHAIFAVGYITIQWAALYDTVMWQIEIHKQNPLVPDDIKCEKIDQRQLSNITYLRRLGAIVYANERDEVPQVFDRNIAHILSFKADRDKLAHGLFSAQANAGFDGIAGVYSGKNFKISTKRLNAVASGISRSHSLLLEFSTWAHAPQMVEMLRLYSGKLG